MSKFALAWWDKFNFNKVKGNASFKFSGNWSFHDFVSAQSNGGGAIKIVEKGTGAEVKLNSNVSGLILPMAQQEYQHQ